VESLSEFQRLRDVLSAPLFGQPQYNFTLLPTGCDALTLVLRDTFPNWTVASLTAAAYHKVLETDEISLVGLAARIRDSVVLTALRESVVLYASLALGCPFSYTQPQYLWAVDKDLAQHARRFIDTFNLLFDEELPPPDPAQAERYWIAYENNEILGRCVRLGYDDSVLPVRHYHWAICKTTRGEFVVQEFWKPELWTTSRYLSAIGEFGR
jgi:hypothetical protein